MATSKQPAFPHPPLEVGVPNYPTPSVPDFYTKSGHIILVVKESVEKGSYNPKPLDGSIIYTGRDANKWPSTLYLVHQAPTPDGEFVYNTYANDRSLASQDPWNYNISYSGDNPSYPIITREYIVPRSQYSTVPLGTVDPVFGGSAYIVKQEMEELLSNQIEEHKKLRSRYVRVIRVYETTPGPQITSYDYDANLDLTLQTTTQTIDSNSSIYTLQNGDLGYQDKAIDSWKSIRMITSIKNPYSSTEPIRPRTEYTSGTFSTPNLVTGLTSTTLTFPDGSIQFNVTPLMRAKRSYVTTYNTNTTFVYGTLDSPVSGEKGLPEPYFYTTSGEPGGSPSYQIFDPEPVNLHYEGYFININIPECATIPNLTVTFDTSTAPANVQAKYGALVETYTAPVTTVRSVAGYDEGLGFLNNPILGDGVIGTFQLISVEMDYWKANIWKIVKKYVFIK